APPEEQGGVATACPFHSAREEREVLLDSKPTFRKKGTRTGKTPSGISYAEAHDRTHLSNVSSSSTGSIDSSRGTVGLTCRLSRSIAMPLRSPAWTSRQFSRNLPRCCGFVVGPSDHSSG